MAGKKTATKKAPAKKAAATKAPAKKTEAKASAAPAKSAGAKPSKSPVAKPIKEVRPGWTSRVFGIETARLMACDAVWDGQTWQRGDKFTFIYRSRRAKFFVLHDIHNWTHVSTTDAKKIYASLPEKLMTEEVAFAPREDTEAAGTFVRADMMPPTEVEATPEPATVE
jgi:hypothetical protein